MNNYTTARLPLRVSERVVVLMQRFSPDFPVYTLVPTYVFGQRIAIGESLSYSYAITEVDDSYAWGAHMIPRKGLNVNLRWLNQETGETLKQKDFFIAWDVNPENLANHMESLTDELLEQWFKEREKKSKKGKKNDA